MIKFSLLNLIIFLSKATMNEDCQDSIHKNIFIQFYVQQEEMWLGAPWTFNIAWGNKVQLKDHS